MKSVSVKLFPAGDGQVVIGFAAVQKLEGSRWVTIEIFKMRSDDPSTERMLLLDENERVIVQGTSNVEQKFDPNQFSVRSVVGPTPGDFEVADTSVVPGPIPVGPESRVGVWREGGEQDWSRTGAKYRIY